MFITMTALHDTSQQLLLYVVALLHKKEKKESLTSTGLELFKVRGKRLMGTNLD